MLKKRDFLIAIAFACFCFCAVYLFVSQKRLEQKVVVAIELGQYEEAYQSAIKAFGRTSNDKGLDTLLPAWKAMVKDVGFCEFLLAKRLEVNGDNYPGWGRTILQANLLSCHGNLDPHATLKKLKSVSVDRFKSSQDFEALSQACTKSISMRENTAQ